MAAGDCDLLATSIPFGSHRKALQPPYRASYSTIPPGGSRRRLQARYGEDGWHSNIHPRRRLLLQFVLSDLAKGDRAGAILRYREFTPQARAFRVRALRRPGLLRPLQCQSLWCASCSAILAARVGPSGFGEGDDGNLSCSAAAWPLVSPAAWPSAHLLEIPRPQITASEIGCSPHDQPVSRDVNAHRVENRFTTKWSRADLRRAPT